MLTGFEMAMTIALCSLATILTRSLPFIVFREGRPTPPFVKYLGNALPSAIFALLCVYCIKDVSWQTAPYGMPELLGILATVLTHLLFRNFLLSIALGTAFYMLLIQVIFA